MFLLYTGIVPENEEQRRILVKQCYPFQTRGVQECEALRKRAMEETSRVINTDGTVVKSLNDGTTQVRISRNRKQVHISSSTTQV